eukprot:765800-Hanusia_phi.AAC.8
MLVSPARSFCLTSRGVAGEASKAITKVADKLVLCLPARRADVSSKSETHVTASLHGGLAVRSD